MRKVFPMSSDASAVLALPYIQPAQAQKHVTHNEALRLLDVLVQLTVTSRSEATPPASPDPGARYLVPAGALAGFAGQDGRIALFEQDVWVFFAAQPGWRALVLDEGVTVVFDGSGWTGPAERDHMFGTVGVGATADATNRLAVAAPATLLTHAGAGHQLKLNKAAPGDTASLLFQTGWSGRAEMGTAGDDSLSIRVSADGAAWTTALTVAAAGARVAMPGGIDMDDGSMAAPALAFAADPDTGLSRPAANAICLVAEGAERARVTPAGLSVTGLVTGTAVQAHSHDATAGRLARNAAGGGIFGWGQDANTANSLPLAADANAVTVSGLYRTNGTTTNLPEASFGLLTVMGGAGGAGQAFQEWRPHFAIDAVGTRVFVRKYNAGVWQPWSLNYNQRSILGVVAQSGGIPTGAVIETGANANGRYTRLADGTQICAATIVASSSADVVWTFPAAFATGSAARHVLATPRSTTARSARVDLASSGTSVGVAVHNTSGARQAGDVDLIAIGRWFA